MEERETNRSPEEYSSIMLGSLSFGHDGQVKRTARSWQQQTESVRVSREKIFCLEESERERERAYDTKVLRFIVCFLVEVA